MLSVKQGGIKFFGVTRPGIEPRSPGPLANTLTAGPMSRLHYLNSTTNINNDHYNRYNSGITGKQVSLLYKIEQITQGNRI